MNGNNEDENSLVSIIINCYNGEKYLKEAIDSVYSQSYKNWEIIFWDNCSTDNSKDIIKCYDNKIKYFYAKKHTNLGEARNEAIKISSGNYITFIDCDDQWFPDKLYKQVRFMKQNPNFVLSYGSVIEMNQYGAYLRRIITIHNSGFILKDLLIQFDIPIISTILNSKLLKKSGLQFDVNILASEEYCLFMQLSALFEIGVQRDILVKYRVHKNSLTSNSLKILSDERRYTLNRIIYKNPILYKNLSSEFTIAFSRAIYYDARYNMSINNKKDAIKNMKSIIKIDYRYLILYLVAFLPITFWKKIHLLKQGRI
jgi:glycosyltransferase involved in cell wall biosynthesis